MTIPINIEKLLSGRVVESERIEYKRSWNPEAIYRAMDLVSGRMNYFNCKCTVSQRTIFVC